MGEKRRNGFCLSWSFSVVSGNVVGLFPGERAGLVGRRLGDFVFSWSVAWASSARDPHNTSQSGGCPEDVNFGHWSYPLDVSRTA